MTTEEIIEREWGMLQRKHPGVRAISGDNEEIEMLTKEEFTDILKRVIEEAKL